MKRLHQIYVSEKKNTETLKTYTFNFKEINSGCRSIFCFGFLATWFCECVILHVKGLHIIKRNQDSIFSQDILEKFWPELFLIPKHNKMKIVSLKLKFLVQKILKLRTFTFRTSCFSLNFACSLMVRGVIDPSVLFLVILDI